MIVVTATSFMKEPRLRQLLGDSLPAFTITYVENAYLLSEEELIAQLRLAKAWLVGRETVSRSLLNQTPHLEVIAKYGVGLDNVDVRACQELGVRVAWEGGVNRDAVAEHTVGLILALTRNISLGSRLMSQGIWLKDGGTSLGGKKVGIVGLGHIGYRVAQILKAFSCELKFCDILNKSLEAKALGAEQMTYEQLLGWADILSFHVPLDDSTRAMFDRRALEKTRAGVRVINTSRGGVLVEADLKEALIRGHLAGLALDVFEKEPLKDKELYRLDNFVGTAHTAGNSCEAVWAMGEAAVKGLQKELGFVAKKTDLGSDGIVVNRKEHEND